MIYFATGDNGRPWGELVYLGQHPSYYSAGIEENPFDIYRTKITVKDINRMDNNRLLSRVKHPLPTSKTPIILPL